jgi:hypothetical protein
MSTIVKVGQSVFHGQFPIGCRFNPAGWRLMLSVILNPFPKSRTFSRTPHQWTDKCRRDRNRKLIRFSAPAFACRKLIRYRGLASGPMTDGETPIELGHKSNHFRDSAHPALVETITGRSSTIARSTA